MSLLEAECTRCLETFVPHGVKPVDLIHGVTEVGDDCGGIGVIQGVWVAQGDADEVATQLGEVSAMERHGMDNPDCANLSCIYHHPDRVVTVEQAREVLTGVGWSTRDLDRWNDDELIHYAREEKS